MKKNIIRWCIVLTVALAVYHVVIFAVPIPRNNIFFLSWAFTLTAVGAQAYVVHVAFYRGEGVKSKFYGFPIAQIGMAYLAFQLALSMGFMVLSSVIVVPMWLPLVLYVILLGASIVGFISADAMRDEIERQDMQMKKDVQNIRMLQVKAASMVQHVQDSRVRAALEKFSEDLRYSDPVSNDALKDIEADLIASVDELQQAVLDSDNETVLALLQKAGTILTERNRWCKLEKG